MTVQLSSLRVTADMDVSPYTRAMAEKVAADRQGATSSTAVGTALANVDAQAEKTASGVKRLSGSLIEGYKSGSTFEKTIRDVGRAVDTGMNLDRAQLLLDAAYRKFGLVADAAQLAKQGFVSIGPVIQELTAHYNAQAAAQEKAATATRLHADAQQTLKQRLADAAAGNARASSFQSGINSSLGVKDDFGGAGRGQDITAFAAEYDRYVQGLVKVRDAEEDLARSRARNAQAQINGALSVRDSFDTERRSADIEAFARNYDDYSKSLLRARREEEALARTRASAAQSQINDRLGVRTDFNTQKRGEDIAAFGASLDQGRARRDPVWAATKEYNAAIDEINAKWKTWGITEEHRDGLTKRAEITLKQTTQSLKNNSAAVGLNANQWTNLGYQVNDVGTMLLSGSSPMQVLATQGGQIYQVLSDAEGGVGGALKSIGLRLLGLVTPAVVAGSALLAIGVAGVTAYNSWRNGQREITMALSGIGRASGSTAESINAISFAAAGVSQGTVGEARTMANALAATGRIGDEMAQKLVMAGKDIARTFGTDAAGAAAILAQSFSDPARGVEQLNARLGAFSAATIRNVQSLTAQNRTIEAQQVLYDGVKSSLVNGAELTSGWGRMWDSAASSASRYWAAAGKAIDKQWGTGGTNQDQLEAAERRLAELQTIASRRTPTVNQNLGTTAEIERARAEVERLRDAMADAATKSADIKANLDSIKAMGEIRVVLPEPDALRALQDRAKFLATLAEDPVAITKSGFSTAQVKVAAERAAELAKSYKTPQEAAIAQAELANKAITARSAAERASIAMQQKALELNNAALLPAEKQAQIQLAYNNALKEGNFQLSEAGRMRLLSIQDAIGGTQAEIDGIGRTAREAELLRLNWQTYADLRREAAQNNTAIDQAQVARLQQENALLVARKELLAKRALEDDLGFQGRQLGRTDVEQRVAGTLRSSGLGEDLDGPTAGLIRMNEQLAMTKQLTSDFGSSFVSSMMGGASAVQSLNSALGSMASKLANLVADQATTSFFNASKSFITPLLSGFFGGGGTPLGMGGIGARAAGGIIQGPGTGTSDSILSRVSNGEFVVNAHATSRNRGVLEMINSGNSWSLPGFADGGMVGGPQSSGMVGGQAVNVNVYPVEGTSAEVQKKRNGDGSLSIDVIMKHVDAHIASSVEGRGSVARKLEGTYGLKRKLR